VLGGTGFPESHCDVLNSSARWPRRRAAAAPRSPRVSRRRRWRVRCSRSSSTDLRPAECDADGRATSRQLVERTARIDSYDKAGPAINAFITLNPDALNVASALDAERRAGKVRGPLHGIPIVVKDNYATADMPTTAGSASLAGFKTGSDAFMVKKLRDAGAVIIGKTNLHELAYGITSISSLGGQTRNPYDPARNPGGSSGETGAAVAANFAAAEWAPTPADRFAIRRRATTCSAFVDAGCRAARDRAAVAQSDTGGPFARTVTDLAIMLDATVGVDPADPVSSGGTGHIPQPTVGVGDSGIADVDRHLHRAVRKRA
jgi:Asp-tRNA(Asn)/Glu-tRNA(Gln) amidotransferase A subunit family amidase